MARAADYDIVNDGKVTLQINPDLELNPDLTHDFPIGMSSPDVTHRSILSLSWSSPLARMILSFDSTSLTATGPTPR